MTHNMILIAQSVQAIQGGNLYNVAFMCEGRYIQVELICSEDEDLSYEDIRHAPRLHEAGMYAYAMRWLLVPNNEG